VVTKQKTSLSTSLMGLCMRNANSFTETRIIVSKDGSIARMFETFKVIQCEDYFPTWCEVF